MNPQQSAFLEHIAMLIPKLFEAIRLGNVKSECVLGDRIIGKRQVRLKLVAEVVDAGSNPLATHSQLREVREVREVQKIPSNPQTNGTLNAVTQTQLNPVPRRGPRRKHPMSKAR